MCFSFKSGGGVRLSGLPKHNLCLEGPEMISQDLESQTGPEAPSEPPCSPGPEPRAIPASHRWSARC